MLFLPGKFKQYDHGILNNKNVHGTYTPPSYDVSKIKVPIHLFYSKNDWLANVKVITVSFHFTLGLK